MGETTAGSPSIPDDPENGSNPVKKTNYYAALGDAAEETRPTQDAAVLMARKNRKKFKKLKKRAGLVVVASERSGLLTRSEFEEYQEQLLKSEKEDGEQQQQTEASGKRASEPQPPSNFSLPPIGTSISVRKKCVGIESVEAATHRDLLCWLLQQKLDENKPHQGSNSSKKRRRDEEGNANESQSGQSSTPKDNAVSIPHWASVHNPGACEQVAVLEINVPDETIEPYTRFLKSLRSNSGSDTTKDKGSCNGDNSITDVDSGSRHCFPHSQVGVGTKWFQGYMPKSMSESLMYFSNTKKDSKKKESEEETIIPSKKELIERLEAMLLSAEEMDEQGYPKSMSSPNDTQGNQNDAAPTTEKLEPPAKIPSQTAKDYVTAFGVRIEEQNIEDKSSYIETPSNKPSNGGGANEDHHPARVFGLDCEMVQTKLGKELARVTLLQFEEFVGPQTSSKTTVLLDCLVRPTNNIVDYLTKHSGITPKLLEPISTRLEQVQFALASFLTPNDILIGHSLENDLRAMHYIHPRVVDTSMIFRPSNKTKGFKFSLRHLSYTLLKKKIQSGSHCSEEDAQTTLDLALLKALKGDALQVPGFGDDQRQSLVQQRVVRNGVAAFIGPTSWLETHVTKHPNGAHALSYDVARDVKKAMLAWMTNSRKAHLIWSRLEFRGKANSNSGSDSSIEIFQSLVTALVEKMPPRCVLMVAIQGELQKTKDMFKRRGACRDPRATIIWSEHDEEAWKEQLNSTRTGYVHWFSASIDKN